MEKLENILITVYRHVIPDGIRRRWSEMLYDWKMEKMNRAVLEKKSFGDLNKDKTFYVIRTDSTQRWGVFSTYLFVLSNIKYAQEHGWIPVVDYMNYYLVGMQDSEYRGKENAWNYYFEDLVPEYSLEEVYQSRNVILGPLRGQPCGSISWNDIADMYGGEMNIYYQLASNYLRVQPDIIDRTELIYKELFPVGEKVLGVGIRAGTYWGIVTQHADYENHPAGMSAQQCIQKIHLYMNKYHCQYFYLSCEDEYYVDTIRREFGKQCLYFVRPRRHFFDMEGKPQDREQAGFDMKNYSMRAKNMDYMVEILLLAKCQYLLGNKGGGTIATFFLKNGKYEESVIL